MTSVIYSLKGKKVWVAGHGGMVGSALCRRLESEGCNIITASRSELNLLSQSDVADWVAQHKPQAVFIAAAKVGGIYANDTQPADFLYDNLMIQNNIIHSSFQNKVEKLIFLGSSCIYPKFAEQPITEDSLLTGSLEPTNQWYALAKIAGIRLCQAYRKQHGCDYISAMPTNLYGVGDNYDLTSSHVIPALLRKAHEAKINGLSEIEMWGTGSPRREFLYVDDCADAVVFLMKHYSDFSHVNVGSGTDLPIEELALLIMKTIGIDNPTLRKDTTKPDGTPRKLMSGDMLKNMGWTPKIDFKTGILKAYDAFCKQQ